MRTRRRDGSTHIPFESYGVSAVVELDDGRLEGAVRELLPPGWRETAAKPSVNFALRTRAGPPYVVEASGVPILSSADLDVAIGVLDARIRAAVAEQAEGRVFVHAGVVADGDRALVLPGPSFAGKTTLVAALVALGATYFSDEFAVLDEEGWIHPFPKPLSVRTGTATREVAVSQLGGRVGERPARATFVAVTTFRAGARWEPRPLEPRQAALALLVHTIVGRTRSAEAMRAVRAAIDGVDAAEGERGEAEETAEALLGLLAAPRGAAHGA